jgi:hypothetical protein
LRRAKQPADPRGSTPLNRIPLRDNTSIAYPYASTPDEPALHQVISMSVD